MKFTIIGPVYPYRGGIAHYTYHLDRAIKEYGHSTQIISFLRQYPDWLYPGKNDKDPSHVKLLSTASFILDPLKPSTWYKAVRTIASWDPDLVVIHWWTTFWGIPYSLINRKLSNLGYKIVYLVHNVLPHEERIWDRFLAKFTLSKGDNFIVQTPKEQERLKALLPEVHSLLCKHPVYPSFSNKKLPKTEARKLLKVPLNDPLLLFFGIVRSYKGLHILIEALGILRRRGITPNLLIAGEFWENVHDFIVKIEKLELSDQIFIENRYIPNEDVELFFSAANIMVAPYLGGSQSGAASIALSHSLPLIASKHIAEGIKLTDKKLIWTFTAGDVIELADTIQNLLSQLDQLQFLEENYVDDWIELTKTLVMCATHSKARQSSS